MIVNNWLDRFWTLIGKHFSCMQYEFGSKICPQGYNIFTSDQLQFTPQQIWFTAHNPREVSEDWSQINLIRVLSVENGVSIVANVKSSECKVSWFGHA